MKDNAPIINSGDLLVWTTNKNEFWLSFSNIIRIFTKSEYIHVGIALVLAGRTFVVEAVPPYARITPESATRPDYLIPMNLDWHSDTYDSLLLSYVGRTYGYLDVLRAYFLNPKDDKYWQCVELVKDFYKSIGLKLPGKYTPSALVKDVLDLPNTSLIKLR